MDWSYEQRQALAKANPRLFEVVVDCYSPWLYRLAYRLSGDHHTSLDLVQEVFFHIFQKLSHYCPEEPFEPWLKTVAYRKLLKLLRKRSRREVCCESLDEVERPAQVTEGEIGEDLMQTLYSLPENYRIVLTLKYQEGLSVEAIAELLGRPEGTVKTWLQRARRAFRQNYSLKHKES